MLGRNPHLPNKRQQAMAIFQRDRDFHRIFSEINVSVIPLKYIKTITCYLRNGTKVTIAESDIVANDCLDLESMIKTLDFYESVADIKININYDLVEREVTIEVDRILARCSEPF